ncbi:MAG: DNA alkylation repair protein [Pseudomonadota bacterium]
MSAILDALRAVADPASVTEKARYHKTELPVIGATNPEIDAAVRAWQTDQSIAARLAEAEALWHSGIFEARIAAGKLLTKARFKTHEGEIWERLASWVPEFDCWAVADHTSSALGRRIMADLSRMDAVEAWTRADRLWTKRAALIATLPLAKLPHPKPAEAEARQRVLGWAAGYAEDHRWFIQKAIGWWLRDLSKHAPDETRAFVAEHGARMKAFARREALRKLA